MSTSKKSSTPVVVGRKLRRYLGALLAIGFGATWWSFVPPSTASASVPAETQHVRATPRAIPVAVVPSYVPVHPTTRLLTVTPHKRPRPHHVAPKLHVVIEQPPVIDTRPVTLPVVQMPVVEPVPEPPQPVEDPYLIPIRTRSS